MKKFKILLIIFLIPFIIAGVISVKGKGVSANVQAFGQLTATYLNVPLGAPIFNVVNMFPGSLPETRTVKVKNDGKNTTQIYTSADRTGPNGQSDPKLETVLNIQIKQGSDVIYSDKLSKFFDDSKGKKGIRLDNIQKGQTKNFDFIVTFPTSAGNEFQEKSVIFNITFSDNNGDVKGDHDEHDDHDDDDHDDDHDNDHHDKKTFTPKPTATPKPTSTPRATPTFRPTSTPRHDDDHAKYDFRKFVDDCKNAVNKFFNRH